MFIDTHCHFDFPAFVDDIANALAQTDRAGVKGMIIPAVSVERFAVINQLAKQYPPLYAALGLHPIYHHQKNALDLLENELCNPSSKLVAVGEIGLDNYVETPPLATQLLFFREQLALAKQYHFPVILHSRRTHALLLKELKMAKLSCGGVIHGFSGSYEEAMQFIKLGYYIGVGGVISYDRAKKTRDTISRLPLSSLLLETDSPDMPLFGAQGQPNRPENLIKVFELLCDLRLESSSQIRDSILINTLTLFSRVNTIELQGPSQL